MFQTKLNLSNNKFEQTSGSTLNLNGSLSINSFSATTFTISQQPQQGASGDTILVRANDGSIREISQSGITGGGGTTLTFNNGLTEAGGTVSLGGTLTGDTQINTNGYGFVLGDGIADGYRSISFQQGFAYGDDSIAFANSRAFGEKSTARGNNTYACGNNSFSSGRGGYSSAYGSPIPLVAYGTNSFIHTSIGSSVTGNSTTYGANAYNSVILGGLNHFIGSYNDNSAIIGGNAIKLTGNTYIDTTAVSKFAIMSTPSGGTTGDTVLVRDSSTGIIRGVSQSSLGGSGGGTTELNILDISGATSATLSVDNHVIIVDTSSSSQTITLPSVPQNGLNFKIKDNGNALTNEITISGNSKNIDGETTALINTNYGAIELIYQQSVDAWYILSFNN